MQPTSQLKILALSAAPLERELAEPLTLITGRLTAAQNLQVLLQHLWTHSADLLLMIDAPEGQASVPELCREVRPFFQTPILVLERGASEQERIAWLDAGADDILTWRGPAPPELPARCRALVRRVWRELRRDPRAHRMRALGMELDLAGRYLYLPGGCSMALTGQLTRFLALCFHHGEAMVPIETLGQHLFATGRPNVRRQVHALAQAFQQRSAALPGPRPRLELVRNMGYRLTLIDPRDQPHPLP